MAETVGNVKEKTPNPYTAHFTFNRTEAKFAFEICLLYGSLFAYSKLCGFGLADLHNHWWVKR